MQDIFSIKAKKIVYMAQEEANSFNREYVEPEHLLLAIARDRDPRLKLLFDRHNLSYSRIKNALAEATENVEPRGTLPAGEMPPVTKLVFRLAVDHAHKNGFDTVDVDHLLLAVLSLEEGIIQKIFQSLEVDPALLTNSLQRVKRKRIISDEEKTSKTPMLDRFGIDLTALYRAGKIDPVIGRDKEIERMVHILCRRTKNNPCLVGEPGVGKTAIVEGLAARISTGDCPDFIRHKKIVQLTVSNIISGARFRGEFEERMTTIVEEIKASKNIIAFIDEVHTIVGSGAMEGSSDAANILKPALARSEVQTIGATTLREYRRYIERDPALERRFQPVLVSEPSQEDTVEILEGLKASYEKFHGIEITKEAVKAAVSMSSRFIHDRFLPDKAIDLLDEAGALVKLRSCVVDPDITKLERQIEDIKSAEEEANAQRDFKKAVRLHSYACMLKNSLDEMREREIQEKEQNSTNILQPQDIAEIVGRWTGIPAVQLNQSEVERLMNLKGEMEKEIMGQGDAMEAISRTIRRSRARISDPERPMGSFLFLGPTGVGKTEAARALAEYLFGDSTALIRVDMSEYGEKHAISKLIGSPPGYIGYDEGGQLTEKVRRRPYSIVLFDEIEKAHHDLFNLLLQVLEDGRLTDAQGRTVYFYNAIIIMTCNLGSRQFSEGNTIGFSDSSVELDYDLLRKNMIREAKKTFLPEFLNRLDEIVVFRPLSEEVVIKIAEKMLRDIQGRLGRNDDSLLISNEVLRAIVKEGFDPKFGARPLRRAIQKFVEDPIADIMIDGLDEKTPLSLCMVEERAIASPL